MIFYSYMKSSPPSLVLNQYANKGYSLCEIGCIITIEHNLSPDKKQGVHRKKGMSVLSLLSVRCARRSIVAMEAFGGKTYLPSSRN